MNDLTDKEIAELRQIDADAYPAPWFRGEEPYQHMLTSGTASPNDIIGEIGAGGDMVPAARNALPRLLDEVERRRACDAKPGSQIVVDPGGPLTDEQLVNLRRACEGSHGATDLNEFDGEVLHCLDEIERRRARDVRLLEVLKRIELAGAGDDEHTSPCCPSCRALQVIAPYAKPIEHAPDCALAALILELQSRGPVSRARDRGSPPAGGGPARGRTCSRISRHRRCSRNAARKKPL
jgi:hypothetical protein